LSFNSTTRLITGTITGELGEAGVEIRKTLGATVRTIPFKMFVAPYMFAGSFEVLIKNPDNLPVGKSKLTVTGRGVFSATMELLNQSGRTTSGSFIHASGRRHPDRPRRFSHGSARYRKPASTSRFGTSLRRQMRTW